MTEKWIYKKEVKHRYNSSDGSRQSDDVAHWILVEGKEERAIAVTCTANAEINAPIMAVAPEMLNLFKKVLAESGCDGDLCTEWWHEEARKLIAKTGA